MGAGQGCSRHGCLTDAPISVTQALVVRKHTACSSTPAYHKSHTRSLPNQSVRSATPYTWISCLPSHVTAIDTGSTYCVFERGRGEALGLNVENGIAVQFGTASGSFRAFGHELTLTVLGIETRSTVYFAEEDSFDRNVLGRIGWLDRVKLGLIEQEGKLFLSEYKKSGI